MFSLSREIEYWNGLGCQNSCWDEHFGKSVYMSSWEIKMDIKVLRQSTEKSCREIMEENNTMLEDWDRIHGKIQQSE